MRKAASIAIDIGGTFTDVVLTVDDKVFVEKTPTTPVELLNGFFNGVTGVLNKAGLAPSDISGSVVHATTVVTNALIERCGEKIAMVFTEGFSDILEMRDCRRYDMYDLQLEFPKPLVESDHVVAVKERMRSDGIVHQPLDEDEIARVCARIAALGVRSVGICLLHAYKNDAHERQLADSIRRRLPGVHVSLSSEVAPQIREYWRASTTSVNAYAVPITEPYLGQIEARLRREGFSVQPLIMLSSGGVVGAKTAARMPVRMIESGPAAGALGAAFAARALDTKNLLAFDMGGTTAKVCMIQDFRPLVTGWFEIDRMYRFKEGSGLPVTVPTADLIEIGAGGGSIARVDDFGLLKVGPRSAGAAPGPACYGKGGAEATVTDADLVLGLLDPDKFLGGAMRLDVAAAKRVVGELASRLELDAIATARGIYQMVCEAMAGAVRAHAADRGVDYRGIPMLAFGGAGPVHACTVAAILNSSAVVFPPLASVYSAFGSLVTPIRLDLVRSALSRLSDLDWDHVEGIFEDLETEGRKALIEAGCSDADVTFIYAADMRYLGQQFEVAVELPARPARDGGSKALRECFESEYLKRYKLIQSKLEVELVTWRVTATVPGRAAPALGLPLGAGKNAKREFRRVDLWQTDQQVHVVARESLRPGDQLDGPLIIEEAETTIVIPPGWTASLGAIGAITATNNQSNGMRR
ncbi:hydantoinase/oxoprolinase family protein [Bradyrhizobium sp. ma5]|uniref:hydantoinase/oxoprolinase family protein n=1 Tax=Bradyrhizobium sp. ma5 TaxID=3344828 RepID=UPI0035D4B6AC